VQRRADGWKKPSNGGPSAFKSEEPGEKKTKESLLSMGKETLTGRLRFLEHVELDGSWSLVNVRA